MNTISWRSPTIPLPMEINPRTAFERMFGAEATREQRVAQIRKDRSILDSVREDVRALERGLGARDRSRPSEYLDHVREIEGRIQKAEQQSTTDLAVPDAPLGVPESFEDHVGLIFDLLAVAYQADLTRVFTFMMAREASQRLYPQLSEPHHSLSHRRGRPWCGSTQGRPPCRGRGAHANLQPVFEPSREVWGQLRELRSQHGTTGDLGACKRACRGKTMSLGET
jgi:hypothetical protein